MALLQQNTPAPLKAQLPFTQLWPAGQSHALAHAALGQLSRRPAEVSQGCPAGQGPASQQNMGVSPRSQAPFTQASPAWQSHALAHAPASHTPLRPSAPSQAWSGGQKSPEQQYTGSPCAVHAPPAQARPGGQSQAVAQG